MGAYSQGGGGGVAGDGTVPDQFALDKPYDISGEPSAEKMQQMDEMLRYLYTAITRAQDGLDATGAGDVVGPSSAVSGNVAIFSGTTGKLIADGGTFASVLAGVGFVISTLKLTTSQLDTLNATPITIVPAQGTTKQLFLIGAGALTTRSGQWTAGTGLYRFQYHGSTTRLTSADLTTGLGSAGSGSVTHITTPSSISIGSPFTNTAIEVQATVDLNPGAQTATAWLIAVCGLIDAV